MIPNTPFSLRKGWNASSISNRASYREASVTKEVKLSDFWVLSRITTFEPNRPFTKPFFTISPASSFALVDFIKETNRSEDFSEAVEE